MTAQGAEMRREPDFISVILGLALQNVHLVNFSSRALFKKIATTCGSVFFFVILGFLIFGFIFNKRAYRVILSELIFKDLGNNAESKCKRRA